MYRTGVSALIVNSRNEFLFVNLESFEEKYFAIPGGGLEAGESLEEAVYREVFEELNLSRDSLLLVGASTEPVRFIFKKGPLLRKDKVYVGQERYFFGFIFTGNESEIQPQAGEIRKHRWASVTALHKYLLFDDQLQETTEKIAEIFPAYDMDLTSSPVPKSP